MSRPSKYSVQPGDTFNLLKVIELTRVSHRPGALCLCQCGNETMVRISFLVSGRVRSCGCLQKQAAKKLNTTHGGSGSRLHRIWKGLFTRCNNKNHYSYRNYGARGITICPEWATFPPFRDWATSNGYAKDLEIDRRNVNGNYEPENCHWVTPAQNSRNRRNVILVTAFGETKTAKEWSRDERCEMSYVALLNRLKKGWSLEQAFMKTLQ